RLALQYSHEHDAVTAQQSERDLFHALRVTRFSRAGCGLGIDERPSSGAGQTHAVGPPLVIAGRGEQRTQSAEAVGDDLPSSDKLGQRLLYLCAEEMCAIDDLVEEGGAVLGDERRDLHGSGADLGRLISGRPRPYG